MSDTRQTPARRASFLRRKVAYVAGATVLAGVAGFLVWSVSHRMTIEEQKRQSQANLEQIGSALREYISQRRELPPSVVYNEEGKPLHSWRVLLLPYLGETDLYKEFKLDEPWDSPHNRELLPKMPKVYMPPRPGLTDVPHSTFYQVFNGYRQEWGGEARLLKEWAHRPNLRCAERRTAFVDDARQGLHPYSPPGRDVALFAADPAYLSKLEALRVFGISNFYLVAEAGEAVPWTKPADVFYHPDQPLPKLGGLFQSGFHVLRCDARFPWPRNRADLGPDEKPCWVEFVQFSTVREKVIRAGIAPSWTFEEGDWN